MDYRLNNEGIVACVIAQVVSRGSYDTPFVTGMTNLLLQDRIRKKAIATMADQVEELKLLLGQLDGMLFGVIVNSMTMLIEGECLRRAGDRLELTMRGIRLCQNMEDGKCEYLSQMIRDLDRILFKYEAIDICSLYQQYWIAL